MYYYFAFASADPTRSSFKEDEIRYIIGDYCSQYEIEITEEQLAEAVESLAERIEEQEEYNYRCGIYSVNIDILLDNYFEDIEEDNE